MKSKVYIETTIPSYLAGRRNRDSLIAAHQIITHDWWNFRRSRFDLYVSEPVLEEVASGDAILAKQRLNLLVNIPLLPLTRDIMELAETLVDVGPIPRKAAVDALHIAIATV